MISDKSEQKKERKKTQTNQNQVKIDINQVSIRRHKHSHVYASVYIASANLRTNATQFTHYSIHIGNNFVLSKSKGQVNQYANKRLFVKRETSTHSL